MIGEVEGKGFRIYLVGNDFNTLYRNKKLHGKILENGLVRKISLGINLGCKFYSNLTNWNISSLQLERLKNDHETFLGEGENQVKVFDIRGYLRGEENILNRLSYRPIINSAMVDNNIYLIEKELN